MIRPLTCIAFLLACGSGLYVYQAKHRVHVLDDQIAKTVKATEALREQTRMLHAEWTLLNDPARLQQLADQFLTLKTVSPTQFTSLAQLDSRLPAPVAPPAPGTPSPTPDIVPEQPATSQQIANVAPEPAKKTEAASVPAAKESPPRVAEAKPPEPPTAPEHRIAALPVSRPQPAAPRVAVAEPRPVQPRPVEPPRLAEQRPFVRPMGEARMVDYRAAPRPMMPVPMPQPVAAGSLLGMAHGSPAQPVPVPLPRPMPMTTPQYNYGAAGG